MPSEPSAADLAEIRDRLEASGPESLDTLDCLALAIRRGAGRAAPGWAERLLAQFGSLGELLGASPPALRRAATPAIARDIEVIRALHLRALREPLTRRPPLRSFDAVAVYVRAVLQAERRALARALFLDRRNTLICDEVVGQGSINHVRYFPREVLRRALELDAAGIVIVCCHPDRRCEPNAEHLEDTRRLRDAARLLSIAVHDHLIVAGETVVSLRSMDLL